MRECLRLQPELDECGPDHHRSVTVTEKVSVHFSLLEFFFKADPGNRVYSEQGRISGF